MRRFTYLIFTALSLLSACEQVSDTGAKIEVSTNYLEYPCNGGTQEIDITMPCDWSASCEEEWITITPSSGEAGDAKLSVSVTANLSQEPRHATIIIGNSEYEISNEITLSQAKPVQHIFYTSADNQVVEPYDSDEFGANIISNTYENGMGLITFDAPVTSIGSDAFYYCTSLKEVYCKPTTPPTAAVGKYGWDAFSSNASGRKIYVPTASVEAYKAAEYWSDYADYIEGKEF